VWKLEQLCIELPVAIDPHLWLGVGGNWSVYFSESLFRGLSKNMCQPAINGGEQSEKSLQILIISFFPSSIATFWGVPCLASCDSYTICQIFK
jgi:hypothetical protein